MNNKRDFHKKKSGVIVNTNRKDFRRARNRNAVRREQTKAFGENGKIADLEDQIRVLSNYVFTMEKAINRLIGNEVSNSNSTIPVSRRRVE